MRIAVLTVSDSSFTGNRSDISGPTLSALICASTKVDCSTTEAAIVPDEQYQIEQKLKVLAERNDVIITTGGTGFAPRDVTPEATLEVISRRCNGLEIALHTRSLQATPMAALSRAVAGITANNSLIINFPGSVKAVRECWEVLEPIITHAVKLLTEATDDKTHEQMQAGQSR